MDSPMSKPQEVPLSTRQAELFPQVSLLTSSGSSSSLPIRAPLTVDTDTSSDYGSDSGEDEVVNAPKIPFLEHQNDEFVEEGNNVEKDVVFKPFMTDPDEKIGVKSSNVVKAVGFRPSVTDPFKEIVQESSSVEKDVVFKPFVTDPDQNVGVKSGNVGKDVVFRPFVTGPDEKNGVHSGNVVKAIGFRPFVTDPFKDIVQESSDMGKSVAFRPFVDGPVEEGSKVKKFVVSRPIVFNPDRLVITRSNSFSRPVVANVSEETSARPSGEEDLGVERKVVDNEVVSVSKSRLVVVPVAPISLDSDDDSVGSSVEEDDRFSSVAKVPSTGLLGKLSVPEVQVLGVEEEDDREENEGHSEPVLESEVVEDLVSGEKVRVVVNFREEQMIGEKVSVEDDISTGTIKDEGPDVKDVAKFMSLEEGEVSVSLGSSVPDESSEYVVEEIQVPVNREQVTELYNANTLSAGCDSECTSGIQGDLTVDRIHEKEVIQGSQGVGNETDEVKTVIYFAVDSQPLEADSDVGSPNQDDLVDVVMGLRANAFGVADEKSVIDFRGEEVLEPSEDVALNFGITDHANEETTEVDKIVSFDALSVNNQNCELNVVEIDKSNVLEPTSVGLDSDHYIELQNQDEADCDFSGGEIFLEHTQRANGQILPVSDNEVNTVAESEFETLRDSTALADLLNSAKVTEHHCSTISCTSADGSRIFSLDRHAGSSHHNLSSSTEVDSEKGSSKEEEEKKFKIQQIRVKLLKLLQRVGLSAHDPIALQVLHRLDIASGLSYSRGFTIESAKRAATQLEIDNNNELEFSLNILIIGKSGVGKSATINSIFGEKKARVDPFEPSTTSVKEILGTTDGIKIRVLDTPGLKSSLDDQSFNMKILKSVKKFTKKYPTDVVIYADRLDMQTRDLNDLPLLRSITTSFGPSVWGNVVVALTHAASTPPDEPSGSPLSYEMFVAQKSLLVRHLISFAVGDQRMFNAATTIPVCLVENQQTYRNNEDGQFLLPTGETWRPQLLLLCHAMKILSEANSIVNAQLPLDRGKLFGFKIPSLPLPYFLSSLLQSFAHPELPADQGHVNSDTELGMSSDTDQEDEDEYDKLPPFMPLHKSRIADLSKEQREAYFEEYDYRVKLFEKKQRRENIKTSREIKQKVKEGSNSSCYSEEQETVTSAAANATLPDMAVPPSFDAEDHSYRYRFLQPKSILSARALSVTNGWDHDSGYDGFSLEQSLALANLFPTVISAQITKDKQVFDVNIDSSVSAKHGDNRSTLLSINIQSIGEQLAYVLKGETKVKNFKANTTAVGGSVTFLGQNVVNGLKLEDHIAIGKCFDLVGNCGAVQAQGSKVYGVNLEMHVRDKDYPVGHNQATLSLSLMRSGGELVWGCNMQSQLSTGRSSNLAVSAGLNNKRNGQISVRTSSSEQLQIALVGLLPIAHTILRRLFPGRSESY